MPEPEHAFGGLHSKIQELLRELDFAEATAAQKQAIPVLASGKHVLLVAPTGYGKTEAALLPVLDECLEAFDDYAASKKPVPPGFKILYVTPLRALNRDLLRRIERWASILGVTIGVRHGDTTQSERRKQALHPPDLLITTPETLQLLFMGRLLRAALKTVRWVVVDEVHELATSERGYQLAVGLERLEDVLAEGKKPAGGVPSSFQRVGLSATVGSPEIVAKLLGGVGRPVEIVQVKVDKKIEIVVEHPMPLPEDRKAAAELSTTLAQATLVRRLRDHIRSGRSTLVFSNTRDGAELLSSRMRLFDPALPVGVHHGSLSKDARVEAEEAYKDQAVKALICTSSLELGIDVGSTELVVQNGSPRGVERLVQRVGRAGHRTGLTSRGVVLAVSGEDAAEAAVIARRAMGRELEPIALRSNPLGVLANQVIHLAVERREVDIERALRMFKRSAPFESLTKPLLIRLLSQLESQGQIRLDQERGVWTTRGSSRRYVIDNVSMIPDEKTYRVVETARRRTIGTLDEDFVLSYVEASARFIMRGRTWDVLEIKEDTVLVAEGQVLGAIPSWQGEDLPVPWSVAQEVGRLRAAIAANPARVPDGYPFDRDALGAFREEIEANLRKGLKVGTDLEIVLEAAERLVLLNVCFGTRTNETLGRLLEALLSQRLAMPVSMTSDAYRIVLESSGELRASLVEEVLRSVKPETVESLLRVVVRGAPFLRWHLLHSARKFGAIGRDLDAARFSLRRVLEVYRDQPLYEEAIEKVVWETMDVAHVKEALSRLADGRIKVSHQKLSPLGRLGMDKEQRGLSAPEAEPSVLAALKRRLMATRTLMLCVVCGHARQSTVEMMAKRPECPSCSAIVIAPLHPNEAPVGRLVKKKKRTPEEEYRLKRAVAGAHLVATYGKEAVLAMAGRGVGPETAARILGRQQDEAGLLKGILAAEVQFARTRRFWD